MSKMKNAVGCVTFFIALLLLQSKPGLASLNPRPFGLIKAGCRRDEKCLTSSELLLSMRGGASRSKRRSSVKTTSKKTATGKKRVGAAAEAENSKKTALTDMAAKYKGILPLTRIYITLVAASTVLGSVLGDEMAQSVMAFSPMQVLYGEVWRPLTAATFLGPPSISWIMSGYYLLNYGSTLERAYGTAQHFLFLLTEMAILSIFSAVFGQPFFAQSMITAMLYVLSRATPTQKVKWLVFNVPYWTLPYGLMLTDVLQAKSASAALPHIIGILSGHFYHFHKFIWPRVGGEDWLVAPDFLVHRLDPNARKAKETVNKALKSKKKGKGRKLGSSK